MFIPDEVSIYAAHQVLIRQASATDAPILRAPGLAAMTGCISATFAARTVAMTALRMTIALHARNGLAGCV